MTSLTRDITYLLQMHERWLCLQPQACMNQEREMRLFRFPKCFNHTMLQKVRVEDSCNTVGNAVGEQSAAQRFFLQEKMRRGKYLYSLNRDR